MLAISKFSIAVLLLSASAAAAEMSVTLGAPWGGRSVPSGQNCALDGGRGATPPMQVSGLPAGTAMVVVQYNDRDYAPLSRDGGHGTLGYPVSGTSANLPSVAGMTASPGSGVRVVAAARSTGRYASPGYLPPCSGGAGHRYEAVVIAVDSGGRALEQQRVSLGRY